MRDAVAVDPGHPEFPAESVEVLNMMGTAKTHQADDQDDIGFIKPRFEAARGRVRLACATVDDLGEVERVGQTGQGLIAPITSDNQKFVSLQGTTNQCACVCVHWSFQASERPVGRSRSGLGDFLATPQGLRRPIGRQVAYGSSDY